MRRPILVGLAAIVALPVLAVGAIGWTGAEHAIHPRRAPPTHTLAEFGLQTAAQEARFASLDGTPLAGWFMPGGPASSGTIILLHGYAQSRADLLPQAAYLHRAGYNVLLFDFRDSGESGGDAITFGMKEPLDVRGALAYLLSHSNVDPAGIAVQGVSLGAVAGLLAMAAEPRIAAAVAESAFPDLNAMIDRNFQSYVHLPPVPFATLMVFVMERRTGGSAAAVRPVEAVQRLGTRPILVIDDEGDTVNPPHSAQQIYAAASGPKELWRIPGAEHAEGYATDPRAYEQHVLRFYTRYLALSSAR